MNTKLAQFDQTIADLASRESACTEPEQARRKSLYGQEQQMTAIGPRQVKVTELYCTGRITLQEFQKLRTAAFAIDLETTVG